MKLRSPNPILYATELSAGFDILAHLPDGKEIFLHPGRVEIIPTGLYVEEYEEDECLFILPKSGLAAKWGVTVCNSPGLVDVDFSLEVKVILINHGMTTFTIKNGMKIAQGFLSHYESLVGAIRPKTVRVGGFGSTGA